MNLVTAVIATLLLGAFPASAQQTDRDRGIELYREGKFQDAAKVLETAVTVEPNDPSAWRFLGGAYVHMDKAGKAVNAFAKSSRVKRGVVNPNFERSVRITN